MKKSGPEPGAANGVSASGGAGAGDVAPQPEARPSSPQYDVAELMQGAGQMKLRHGGDIYTVRITSAGKLIMTK